MEKETPENDAQEEAKNERKASPISGCLMFFIIVLAVSFGIGMVIWHYFDTKAAMHSISDTEELTTQIERPDTKKSEDLAAKLKSFANKVQTAEETGQRISISFSKEDLNLAFAHFQTMEEFKGRMFITSINENGIEADICLPVRSGLMSQSYRFVHGSMLMQPEIEQGSLLPKIISITPSSKAPVPEKLIQVITSGLFTKYRTDPDIKNVFHSLTDVTLKDNQLLVECDPLSLPSKEIPPLEEGKDNLYIALSIFGILFFIFFSTGCLIYWLRKRSKQMKAQKLAETQTSIEELEQETREHLEAQKENKD